MHHSCVRFTRCCWAYEERKDLLFNLDIGSILDKVFDFRAVSITIYNCE